MSDTADQPPITATNDDTTMSPINTDTKGEAVDIQENALSVDSSTVPLDETNSTTLRETMNDNRSQPTLETGTIRRSGRVRKPTMQYIEAINTKQIVAETQDEQVDDEDKEQPKEVEEENDDEEDQMDEDDEDEDEDDNKVYCLCRKPDDGTVMINCDGCSEWYHAKCVGLTKSKVAKISTYYCPVCISTLPGVSGISSKGAMKPAFISKKGKPNDATTPANNNNDNTIMDTDTSSYHHLIINVLDHHAIMR
ncbi:hypothetical protein BDF22DRAFT_266986 [Syncephalis plumigaleata]|nr:hypothetical protein BDF22DRAFT_266986 [Syncephalis plumigaleata]